MMIGAKTILYIGLDAARDGLARLAGDGWLLGVPRHDVRGGHPAGTARPGFAGTGSAGTGGAGLIAVTFGTLTAPTESSAALPVRWESLEPGDNFTVLLDADITL